MTFTKSTYSKGPWFVEGSHPWKIKANYEDERMDSAVITESHYKPNANLIAAAPELLEALKKTRAALIGYESSDVSQMALRAINKAEGEADET